MLLTRIVVLLEVNEFFYSSHASQDMDMDGHAVGSDNTSGGAICSSNHSFQVKTSDCATGKFNDKHSNHECH